MLHRLQGTLNPAQRVNENGSTGVATTAAIEDAPTPQKSLTILEKEKLLSDSLVEYPGLSISMPCTCVLQMIS